MRVEKLESVSHVSKSKKYIDTYLRLPKTVLSKLISLIKDILSQDRTFYVKKQSINVSGLNVHSYYGGIHISGRVLDLYYGCPWDCGVEVIEDNDSYVAGKEEWDLPESFTLVLTPDPFLQIARGREYKSDHYTVTMDIDNLNDSDLNEIAKYIAEETYSLLGDLLQKAINQDNKLGSFADSLVAYYNNSVRQKGGRIVRIKDDYGNYIKDVNRDFAVIRFPARYDLLITDQGDKYRFSLYNLRSSRELGSFNVSPSDSPEEIFNRLPD